MRKNIHIEHIYALLVLALFTVVGMLYLLGWLTGSGAWTTAAVVLTLIAIVVALFPAGLAVVLVLRERHRNK